MKRIFYLFALIFALSSTSAAAQQIPYSVKQIWSNGSHCAFTSIERFKGRYYCSFREGATHIFDSNGNAEGKVRILASDDGEKWESVAFIGKEGFDLRDPKLSVTPEGKLMVTVGGSIYRNRKLEGCVPHVIFSEDGATFSEPKPIELDKKMHTGHDWLWRVTWYDGAGYGVSYSKASNNEIIIHLMKTTDGVKYELVKSFNHDGYPNEATVRFLPDGRMAIMLRRDAGDCKAMWGLSHAPYTDWQWQKQEFRIGGPDFIVLDDDHIVAGGRSYYVNSPAKTALFTGKNGGNFVEKIVLPSGGDNSYPGFLISGNELWVCYYSTHETKNASIYLAKIPLEAFKR
jgi:hypothetical protein